MLQAATIFSAGLLAKDACAARLPACSANNDDGSLAFKLSVQVHSANVPGLGRPGAMMRLRPRLGIGFGGAWKDTEYGDFVEEGGAEMSRSKSFLELAKSAAEGTFWGESASSSSTAEPGCNGNLFTVPDPQAPHGGKARSRKEGGLDGDPSEGAKDPWRFGDTLTFAAQLRDLLGGGVRVRLAAHSDVVFGPLQVEMPSHQDWGEAVVDLRQRVLPTCVPEPAKASAEGEHFLFGCGAAPAGVEPPSPWWESPVMSVPLVSVDHSPHSGVEVKTVGRVALSFKVNVNPEVLLREADYSGLSMTERIEKAVDRFAQWLQAPVSCSTCADIDRGCDEVDAPPPMKQGYRAYSALGPYGPEDEPEMEQAPNAHTPLVAGMQQTLRAKRGLPPGLRIH